MKKYLLLLLLSASVHAEEKLKLMLDWFINPDHAAIIVADKAGFFKKHGLEVDIIEPADPTLPPKLLAAGEIDLAVDYQPQLHLHVEAGLPITWVGTLVGTPLNILTVKADSGINQLSDLKGKKIGYSLSGFEDPLLGTMIASAGLKPEDVEMVNVNWSISPSLLSGQVDAVIGGFRNFELHQIALEGHQAKAFFPEAHGVPHYDELILIAQKDKMDAKKTAAFLSALEDATAYILNDSKQAWQDFIAYDKDKLDTELNRLAWGDTVPRLSLSPRALDTHRYNRMAKFLKEHGLIKNIVPVQNYTRVLD